MTMILINTLIYILNLSKLGNSLYLNNYWKKGYEIFSLEIYKINFDFLFHYYSFPLLFLMLMILGLYYLYKNNKFYFFNSLSILLVTIFAAFLHIYPFERRLALFLLPVLILLAIYPLDNIKRSWSSAFVLLFSFVFFLSGYINFGKDFVNGKVSYLRQDVKPLLGIIASKSNDENIYLYYGSYASYSYYSRLYSLPSVIWGTYPRDENLSEKYLIADLENLPSGTYYLLFIKGTWTYEKDLKAFDSTLSAMKEALKYTLETGNEKAIENAISNIDRCEGLKNETSAAPSGNNGGYDAQLEKTIKVYTSQIEGKYTQQVAEQYSNYSVEQDLRSGIITQDDAKSQKEKYIEKFKDPTVNKFALLGQLEPSLRKEALKALVKFAPTMINSFIDLGYGPEIIRIIGENSNLAIKIVNLMDFKGQSEVKSIVQRHPDNFEELYAKYFLDDDKPSLAINEYNTAPLGGNSLLKRQDKNGQIFFKI